MAKKNVKPVSDNSVVAEDKASKKNVKETKVEKVNTKAKPKKEKKSMKKKVQEVVSELKKVSKPSFGKVCKDTCVVIAVVSICTLFLFGIDKLFSLLNGLLLS